MGADNHVTVVPTNADERDTDETERARTNPRSKGMGDVKTDLGREVAIRVVTHADHLVSSAGTTAQDHPLHLDPENPNVVV